MYPVLLEQLWQLLAAAGATSRRSHTDPCSDSRSNLFTLAKRTYGYKVFLFLIVVAVVYWVF